MIVTVDVALLTLDGGLKVALHRRDRAPFEGALALPGGYVHPEEDAEVEATAYRVLREKTSFVPRYLEALASFSGATRDPRGWSVSLAYFALIPIEQLRAVPAGVFQFHSVDSLPPVAFDHTEIINAAVRRLRAKTNYSNLPCSLLPAEFTMPQMHQVYEQVLGEIDVANFRRKVLKAGIVEPTGGHAQSGGGAPAALYAATGLKLMDRSLVRLADE